MSLWKNVSFIKLEKTWKKGNKKMNKKRLFTLVTLDFDVQLSCTDVVHLLEKSFATNSILKKMDLRHFGKTALKCSMECFHQMMVTKIFPFGVLNIFLGHQKRMLKISSPSCIRGFQSNEEVRAQSTRKLDQI